MYDFPAKAAFYQDAQRSSFASIIKFPTKDAKAEDTYRALLCTEEDKAIIYEIITTVAENGKVNLLFKQSHLRKLGVQVDHVHPLKFLGTIFSDPHLKWCMGEIFEDYFKRTEFMDGLGPSLTKRAEEGKLEPYLKGFAEHIQVSADRILPFFKSRDWENLVRALIQS